MSHNAVLKKAWAKARKRRKGSDPSSQLDVGLYQIISQYFTPSVPFCFLLLKRKKNNFFRVLKKYISVNVSWIFLVSTRRYNWAILIGVKKVWKISHGSTRFFFPERRWMFFKNRKQKMVMEGLGQFFFFFFVRRKSALLVSISSVEVG